ncbi:MAG: Fic family protein [Patescibacteria group bacterium]|nr:Fic family protein [Patescibacteria group bacterium]
MRIIQKLQKIQKHSGKTQEELAHELGVSFPTINSWINGKSQPREESVQKINSLYVDLIGDTSIDLDLVKEKVKKLKKLQQQYPTPFSTIIAQQNVYNNFLLQLTYHTNNIEGSTFSEPDVRAVLFDDVTIPDKSVREHQEAKNHQAALGFIIRWLRDESGNIDQKLIKHIHQIMMNGIIHNAGSYRTHGVRIAGVNVPTSNCMSIEKHMNQLVKTLNEHEKKLFDQAQHLAQTHARFEQIHPFSDGNGRVGRLLIILLALKYGLAPVIIKKEKKQAYFTYLEEVQVKNNSIPLTSFILDGLFEGYSLLTA